MYEFKPNDAYDFANSIGADTILKGNELFFKYCPKCKGECRDGSHDKETFSINLESGAFKCFRSGCDYHGHFVELARDFNFPLEDLTQKKYKKLPQKKIESKPSAIKYMESRGISEATARKYNITSQKNNPDTIVFPFYDENGILQFVKYRNSKFNPNKDKAKEWCEKDTKPILFGMKQCENFETLVITEGQMDSLSVAECGISNAVSVPTGALGFTWLQFCWDWINKFKKVIVFGDYEKGKITLLDKLRNSLKMPVYSVRTQDYLGEKDANDILRKYGKQAIIFAIDNAEIQEVKFTKRLSEVQSVDLSQMTKIKTGIYEVDRAIGGIYLGQVMLLSGKRGEGKSTLMSQLVAEAIDQDFSTFVYSGELPNYHFKNWLDLQIAGGKNVSEFDNEYGDKQYYLKGEVIEKINAWYYDKAYIFDNSAVEDDEFKGVLSVVEDSVCRYDIKLVCIDNLMTALDDDSHSDIFRQQSMFVKKLARMAKKYNIAIILIAHPKKTKEGFSNDAVSGSSDITNAVDVVANYERNTNESDNCDSKLSITKNRLTGKLLVGNDTVFLNYSPKSKRIQSVNHFVEDKEYGCFKRTIKQKIEDDIEDLPF